MNLIYRAVLSIGTAKSQVMDSNLHRSPAEKRVLVYI